MALQITDASFEEVVLKSEKPVLVDFLATWCANMVFVAFQQFLFSKMEK